MKPNQADEIQQGIPSMEDDLKLRRLGVALIVVFVLGGGAWAALAPLDSAALAPGTVQVTGKRKAVQHLEGGIVSEIYVTSGEAVTSGQPLVRLDAAMDRADLQIVEGRIFNTQAAVDRLKAERDGEEKILFSEYLRDAATSDERAAAAMKREASLFDARIADLAGEESVLRAKGRGLRAVVEAKRDITESLRQEISDLEVLLADGYVDKTRLRQLTRNQSDYLGEIADLEVSLQELDLNILQLKNRFKTDVVDELLTSYETLYDLKLSHDAVADRVNRATIRAPVDGEIIDLALNSVGAVVAPGETLMELVPDASGRFVEARISPMDIDRVQVGQSAEVRFSVFKDAYLVSGTLTKLSADRIIDQSSDIAYYKAEIELLEDDFKLLERKELVPGMPAEVVIKTGQRTMLGYIVSPLARMFSRSLTED
ncbi:MAG: HlyD family type I secretion periplasmic adaptor subunit [Pseudomonadota bacterium]|nr:HlyD family type I secretion periplasmic adaptor subunit [Pseudomonadota bacterium]